ncbi:hypothetical protein [Actinocrispum wychmicini]|uniref:Uncharacterized protein n=1 Tax=Actinocrispum wychmicini TaxID=1213861 RepID=A0A4R2J4Y3_9PSEU|nr:hypothetical protein [Actinocrispum wychmicini]TCO52907.1 hypothetical protein EV192_111101 [Actinocrispum wychmicini]
MTKSLAVFAAVVFVVVVTVALMLKDNEQPRTTGTCGLPFSQGEWATDVVATASMSHAPHLGETVSLVVDTCAKVDGPVALAIILPDGFSWQRAPEAMSTDRRVSRDPANRGCLTTATGQWQLTAMRPMTLTGTVTAGKLGHVAVHVEANHYLADVYLTVGEDRAASRFGWPNPSTSAASADEPPVPTCP